MKRYEQIPHTADMAARVYGKNLPELFENAAFAMFDMMADLKGLSSRESIDIKVESLDTEGLLISWLNEILYISYIKEMLFTEFAIKSLEKNKLSAVVKGQAIKKEEKRVQSEIKAATYHDLEIKKIDAGYEVTVIFDV